MTVLVGYDPQTMDRAPVRFAVAAAVFAEVPLVVASVQAGLTPAVRERDDAVGGALERLRAELARDHGIEVRARIVEAATPAGAARALQSVIDQEHAGLVVVGSTRRGVIGQVAPGTTAQRVINGCACPVIVVPRGHNPPPRLSVIGVAFVPTPEGCRALRGAAAVALMADADLRVLTVVKHGLGADASAGPAKEAAERNRAMLEGTIASAVAGLAGGVRAERDVLVGDPADALISVSRHLDLLVMGSRGYGPGLAVLLGGVSRRVTMQARCPVLVVPRGSTAALEGWGDAAVACTAYPNEALARRAVRSLTAAGIAPRDIRLLVGRRAHEVRADPAGGFAGTVEPTAPVGPHAGAPGARRRGAGTLAADPDDQRQGSCGDSDADAIVTVEDGAGRMHASDHLGVRQLLRRAAIADARADRVIDGLLRAGRAVVLHEAVDLEAGDRGSRLEDFTHAA
jgi:nucleotide-binding universal stress UspA family protein